jgi:hypothetical protein
MAIGAGGISYGHDPCTAPHTDLRLGWHTRFGHPYRGRDWPASTTATGRTSVAVNWLELLAGLRTRLRIPALLLLTYFDQRLRESKEQILAMYGHHDG